MTLKLLFGTHVFNDSINSQTSLTLLTGKLLMLLPMSLKSSIVLVLLTSQMEAPSSFMTLLLFSLSAFLLRVIFSSFSSFFNIKPVQLLKVHSCKLKKYQQTIAYIIQMYPENFTFQLFIILQ